MSAPRIAAMLAVAAACCSLDAAAFYYGLGAGQSTDTEWDDRVIQDGSVSAVEIEDQDTSFRMFAGFELAPNLSLEVGYVNFGEHTTQGDSDGSGGYWSGGPAAVESAVDGFDFGLAAAIPLSRELALLGRVGVLSWEGELTFEDPSFTETYRDRGKDLFFGGGIEFRPDGPLALRAEYSRYSVDDIDVDTVTGSLVYRFWEAPRRHRRGRR